MEYKMHESPALSSSKILWPFLTTNRSLYTTHSHYSPLFIMRCCYGNATVVNSFIYIVVSHFLKIIYNLRGALSSLTFLFCSIISYVTYFILLIDRSKKRQVAWIFLKIFVKICKNGTVQLSLQQRIINF